MGRFIHTPVNRRLSEIASPSTIRVKGMIPSWELTMMMHNDDSSFDQPSLDELVSLREAAKLSGLSVSHLRLLVSRGVIWGAKLGRNWVTTAQAVEEYLARDRRPGPKSKRSRD